MSNCLFEAAFEQILKDCKCAPGFHNEGGADAMEVSVEQKPKSDKFSPNISRHTRSAPEHSWPAPMKFSTEWDNTTREDDTENLRTFKQILFEI